MLKKFVKTSVIVGAVVAALGVTTQVDAASCGTVTASSLYVRSGASTSHNILGTVTKGNSVEIKDTQNGWHKINYKGNDGWVSGKYITSSSSSSTSGSTSTGTTQASKTGTITATSLNVRSGPSTSYSAKSSVKKGNVVGILKQYSNGWYEVKLANGTTGCVSGSYLTITAGSSSSITSGSTSGTTSGNTNTNTGTSTNAKVQAVVNMVKRQVGKPYVYGAAGPNSFDCSGLTYYCYKNAAGITLNRSSAAQASNGRYVSKSELKPGDLIFFNSGTNRIRHVGMYVGNGQFIHAPSPGKSVKYENLYSSYYVKGYVTARRIIG